MHIDIINPIDFEEWDDMLLSRQDFSFFHSSGWAQVLHEAYCYKPLYFSSIQDGDLTCLLPVMEVSSMLTGRRGVSLPFTDYCEPVVPPEVKFSDLFQHITEYGKHADWKFIEVRGGKGFFEKAVPSEQFLIHTLELAEHEQSLFSDFRDSTKRNIRKAIASGIEVRICTSLHSVKEYYRLHCLTRKRHGLPPPPFDFFYKLYQHILSKNKGFVVLGYYKERVISGAIFFHMGSKAIFKYGASDMSYQQLRANNLVMWEAIMWYCRNGYKKLCFGRTELDAFGLRQFKNGWGTQEDVLNYYKYDVRNNEFTPVYGKQRLQTQYTKFAKHMPIFFLKYVSSLLYKHFG
jgi:hypothetical protein